MADPAVTGRLGVQVYIGIFRDKNMLFGGFDTRENTCMPETSIMNI